MNQVNHASELAIAVITLAVQTQKNAQEQQVHMVISVSPASAALDLMISRSFPSQSANIALSPSFSLVLLSTKIAFSRVSGRLIKSDSCLSRSFESSRHQEAIYCRFDHGLKIGAEEQGESFKVIVGVRPCRQRQDPSAQLCAKIQQGLRIFLRGNFPA